MIGGGASKAGRQAIHSPIAKKIRNSGLRLSFFTSFGRKYRKANTNVIVAVKSNINSVCIYYNPVSNGGSDIKYLSLVEY